MYLLMSVRQVDLSSEMPRAAAYVRAVVSRIASVTVSGRM